MCYYAIKIFQVSLILPILFIIALVYIPIKNDTIAKLIIRYILYIVPVLFSIMIGSSIGGIIVFSPFDRMRTPIDEVCQHLSQVGIFSPIIIGAIIGMLFGLLIIYILKYKGIYK